MGPELESSLFNNHLLKACLPSYPAWHSGDPVVSEIPSCKNGAPSQAFLEAWLSGPDSMWLCKATPPFLFTSATAHQRALSVASSPLPHHIYPDLVSLPKFHFACLTLQIRSLRWIPTVQVYFSPFPKHRLNFPDSLTLLSSPPSPLPLAPSPGQECLSSKPAEAPSLT